LQAAGALGLQDLPGNRSCDRVTGVERMTPSSSYYRPSVLELAQAGNFQAIGYWINSFLGPSGIHVQAAATASGGLQLLVDLHPTSLHPQQDSLRQQIVKFICYRLWTLNSAAIREVRIVARQVGQPTILWKQSVRIITPASRRQHPPKPLRRPHRGASWARFQIFRSLFISRLAAASFFLCYATIYWELNGYSSRDRASEIQPASADQGESSKSQLRAISSSDAAIAQPKMRYPEVPPPIMVPAAFRGQVVYHATSLGAEKVVALTFDDGPHPSSTERVLEILKQNTIKATFFMVGTQVQQHPELAKKAAEAGHAIGNHTWRHPMKNLDEATAAQELGNTARLIYQATGVRTALMRPPGGNLKGALVPYAQRQGQTAVLWSVDSDDYYVSAPLIVNNVLRQVRSGGIVLMHDGGGDRTATIQALPQIIDTLKRQGYRFVTVPELLELQSRRG
jgi:peptidoglycan/xylan/chitin deacetylase (PgdA/CDA1 family)